VVANARWRPTPRVVAHAGMANAGVVAAAPARGVGFEVGGRATP
jgi:hypothetical protein